MWSLYIYAPPIGFGRVSGSWSSENFQYFTDCDWIFYLPDEITLAVVVTIFHTLKSCEWTKCFQSGIFALQYHTVYYMFLRNSEILTKIPVSLGKNGSLETECQWAQV